MTLLFSYSAKPHGPTQFGHPPWVGKISTDDGWLWPLLWKKW